MAASAVLTKQTPEDFLKQIVSTRYGSIQLFCPDNKFSHWFNHESLKLIPEYLNSENNYYYTPNGFKNQIRSNAQVSVLNAFFADFDAEKQGYTVDQAYYYLIKSLDDFNLPQPTAVVNSGHGLHLYWSIDTVLVNSPIVRLLWQKVENTIIAKINSSSDIKADPQATSPAQLLRLPMTNNCKRDKVPVSIVELNHNKYSLAFFQDELLPKRPRLKHRPKMSITVKAKARKTRLTKSSLDVARASDIETLVQLRHGEVEGKRELILFLYANHVAQFAEDYQDKVLNLNQQFKRPLTKREIDRKVLKYAKSHYYKLKNTTFIEWLDITTEEQHQLTTVISLTVKRERDKQRKHRRTAAKKQARDTKIQALYAEGLNKSEIAKRMHVSRPTVIKVLKS